MNEAKEKKDERKGKERKGKTEYKEEGKRMK